MKKEHYKGFLSIIFNLVFWVLVIVLGFNLKIETSTGDKVEILDHVYLKETLWIVIAIVVLAIMKECINMYASDNKKLVMVVTSVVNIATIILLFVWLNDNKIKGSLFVEEITVKLANNQFVLSLFQHVALIFAVMAGIGLFVDLVCVTLKTIKD